MGISCEHVNRSNTWFASRYSLGNYKDGYSCRIPSMVVAGTLSVDKTSLVPLDFKRPAGRPSKKRKDQSFHKKTDIQRECQAFGLMGHYARSCTASSTEYRFNRYKEKAVNWCRCAADSVNLE
jgi:hypothetical protein